MSTPTTTDLFDHRIHRAVRAMQATVDGLDPEAKAKFVTNTEMDPSDLLAFGEIPSRGLLAGALTADEASTLHAIHRSYESATPAERAVFLMTMGELLKAGV